MTKTPRWAVPMAWAVTITLAAAAGLWGGRATLEPPAVAESGEREALYTVTEGTIGRVITFVAEARWNAVPLAANSASGTVTTVELAPGDLVEPGQSLYSVDLRPVIAAEGTVPSFRDLHDGLRGADVEQLQSFLAGAGYHRGEVTGVFDAATISAVREWQAEVGVEADAIVRLSDLIFLPSLPARAAPAAELRVGNRFSGGEPAIDLLPDLPEFTITLGPEQADLVPLSATVVVHHPSGSWDGVIASSTSAPTGELVLTLEGADSPSVCGEQCAAVPIGEAAVYTTDVIVVPETTGAVVPSSALGTRPDGSVTITTEDGHEVDVEIVAAAEGRAVVTGIDPGSTIRLFAPAADRPAASATP